MTQKPKPKDYPFNYSVQWTEHDWEDFPSYREAERAIRKRFPVAFIETEWDSSLHTKFVFRDPLTAREVMDADDWYEDALERCVAQIERRRDAYESALAEWEGEMLEMEMERQEVEDKEESSFGCPKCGNGEVFTHDINNPTWLTCEVCGFEFADEDETEWAQH